MPSMIWIKNTILLSLTCHFLSPVSWGSWNEIYWGGEFENSERDHYFVREFYLPQSGPYIVCTTTDLGRDDRLNGLAGDERSCLESISRIIQPSIVRGLYFQLSKPESETGKRFVEAFTSVNYDEPAIPGVIYPQYIFRQIDIPKLIDTLGKLKYLRHLELYQFPLDKPMFSELCSLSQLEHLGLPQCTTDEFLESVASLKQLRFLNASGTEISGKGFHWLTKLENLETLDLRGTKLNEDSLETLKGVKSLKILLLAHSKVTDDHLKNIGELDGLTSITLHHTAITDEGLCYLSGIRNLSYVSLYDTKTTPEGHQKLSEVIPGIVIDTERPTTRYVSDMHLPFSGYAGDAFAQYWLGRYNTVSAPVDALMWYILCNEQIHSMSVGFQTEVRDLIAELKAKLKPEQISEAEQKVRAVHQFQRHVKMEFQIKQYHDLPLYQYHFQERK